MKLCGMLVGMLALRILSGSMAEATDFDQVGPTDDPGAVLEYGDDLCEGLLVCNHDHTFENGCTWQYGGVVPPYYGAFAEGFDLGETTLRCVVLWITQIDLYAGGPCDVYVWDGGCPDAPGAVLSVTPDVDPGPPAYWPDTSRHDIDIPDLVVDGSFAVGYWGAWPGAMTQWFVTADLDGPGGHPWTYIAPGTGFPMHWRDPSVVWGPIESLGLGCLHGEVTRVEGQTWGAIKGLFE